MCSLYACGGAVCIAAFNCLSTKIGVLYLVASVRGLQGVYWRKQAVPFASALVQTKAIVLILRKAKRQINQFLKDDRQEFDFPLDFAGSDFQNKVWRELQRMLTGGLANRRGPPEFQSQRIGRQRYEFVLT